MSDKSGPSVTLWRLRGLWAFLLLGQVVVGLVLVLILLGQEATVERAATADWLLTLIPVSLLVVLTPLGYFIRNQCYKARWQGDAVAPAGYFNGNFVLLAMMESVAIAALVMMFVTGRVGLLAVAGVAVAVQVINFPTGAPMRPRRPAFAQTSNPRMNDGGDPPTL